MAISTRRPRAMYSYIIGVLASVLCGLSACSELTTPDVVQPAQPDTTSHEYNWEYYAFGESPIVLSTFTDIHVISDSEYWIVGDVVIDSTIESFPNRIARKSVNAIHYSGSRFQAMLVEGVKNNGAVNTMKLYSVTGGERSVLLFGGRGCTEIGEDTVVFHDIRDIGRLLDSRQILERGRSGAVYLFGGEGVVARIHQSKPFSSLDIERLSIPTFLQPKAFVEISVDEFYIGSWDRSTLDHVFHHYRNGEIVNIDFAPGEYGDQLDWCTSLWASETNVYATCTPFLYKRNLVDTSEWAFDNILDHINELSIGIPYRMTGRGDNDIFFVGDASSVYHYNGATIKKYQEIDDRIPVGAFRDVVVTEDKVYIVGAGVYEGNPRALLIVGTKQ